MLSALEAATLFKQYRNESLDRALSFISTNIEKGAKSGKGGMIYVTEDLAASERDALRERLLDLGYHVTDWELKTSAYGNKYEMTIRWDFLA